MAVLAGISQTPLTQRTILCRLDHCGNSGDAEAPHYHAAITAFLHQWSEDLHQRAAAPRLACVMAARGLLSLMRCCVCVSAKWTFSSGSVKAAAVDPCSPSIMPENSHWPGPRREAALFSSPGPTSEGGLIRLCGGQRLKASCQERALGKTETCTGRAL